MIRLEDLKKRGDEKFERLLTKCFEAGGNYPQLLGACVLADAQYACLLLTEDPGLATKVTLGFEPIHLASGALWSSCVG